MTEKRHKVAIDLEFDPGLSNGVLDALQARLDRLSDLARKIGSGQAGPGGGSGAPGTPGTPGPSSTGPGPSGTGGGSGAPGAPGAPGPSSTGPGPSGGGGPGQPGPSGTGGGSGGGGGGGGSGRGGGGSGSQGSFGGVSSVNQQIASSVSGSSPALPLEVAQTSANVLLQRGMENAPAGSKRGMAFAGLAAALPFIGVAIAGISQRYGRSVRLADIQKTLGEGNLYGLGGGGGSTAVPMPDGSVETRMSNMNPGADYGIGPEEYAQQRAAFGRAAGFNMSGKNPAWLRLSMLGVGLGSMAQYTGLQAAGVGGQGGRLENILSQAFADGLRGARLDQYLAEIASGVESLGQRGMRVDLNETENFIAGVRGAAPGVGSRAPAFAGNLSGLVGSARDALTSPFQALAQAQVMAAAFRGGGGLRGAIGRLDEAGIGPGGAAGFAYRAMRGPGAALGFAGMGLGMDEAEAVAKGLDPASATFGNIGGAIGSQRASRRLASTLAKADTALLESLTQEEALATIERVKAIEAGVDRIGAAAEGLVELIEDAFAFVKRLF